MTTPALMRLEMAKVIVDFEARRDKQGHLVVYQLPSNDGGGRYEVAGINEKYDKKQVDHLVVLLRADKYDEAETYAEEYIASNTDAAAKWTSIPCLESYLRDIVFNRGQGGAVRTLRHALGIADSSTWTDESRAAMLAAEKDPIGLLDRLRASREWYERSVVGYRSNFWSGLVNRWNDSLVAAKKFPSSPVAGAVGPAPPPPPAKPTSSDDFAARVVRAMETLHFPVDRGSGELNIVYVQGADVDGTPNANRPNAFDDCRLLIGFEAGLPKLVGAWEATTHPGKYWTQNRMNPAGAFHIALGPQEVWQHGEYHDAPALRQVKDVRGTRDDNADMSTVGDAEDVGQFGVHHHGGYDYPKDDLGRSSAGCQVGRSVSGHARFMALLQTDPRYKTDPKRIWRSTVLTAAQVAAAKQAPSGGTIILAGGAAAGGAAATTAATSSIWDKLELWHVIGALGLVVLVAVLAVAITRSITRK